ncbi:MAG TPA: restriction endonuclease [Anaerolineae bacterium]|nr:restriction endonuclease [Anaerolineae bacterium]
MPDFNPFDMDFDGNVDGIDFLGFDYLTRHIKSEGDAKQGAVASQGDGVPRGLPPRAHHAQLHTDQTDQAAEHILLERCPICLEGPVVRQRQSRLGGLRVKTVCVCRACGSVLEQSGEKYRYRIIPSPYRESGEDLCKESWSLDDLRRAADKRWRSQQSAFEEREWREWVLASEREWLEPGFEEVLALDGREEEERAMADHDQQGKHQDSPKGTSTLDDLTGPGIETLRGALAALEQFLPPSTQDQLSVAIQAAKARGEVLRPVLLCGPTDDVMAFVSISVVWNKLLTSHAGGLEVLFTDNNPDPDDVVDQLVTCLRDRGDLAVLGFTNIHMASQRLERWLTRVLPNLELSTVIGGRAALRGIEVPCHGITVIGTTDRPESLSPSLRSCFHHICDLGSYGEDVLATVIASRANSLGLEVEDAACLLIARIARGGGKEAFRLVDLVRDFAEVRAEGMITAEVACEALGVMGVEIGDQDLRPSRDEEPAHTLRARTADRDRSELESVWAQLFESLGYSNIRMVRLEGDAQDCILMESPDPLRGTRRVCVRLEYWTSDIVGLQAVQVLHSTIVANPELDEGIIVTSGRFSDEAITYADKIGIIQLVDETRLQALTNNPGKRSLGESADSGGGHLRQYRDDPSDEFYSHWAAECEDLD